MDKDMLLLVAGAVIGFVSAVTIEFIRQAFEKRKVRTEREYTENQIREKNIREFLDTEGSLLKTPLAWLKLVTTKPPSLWQRLQGPQRIASAGSQLSRVPRAVTDRPRLPREPKTLDEESSKDSAKTEEQPTLQKFILRKTQIIGRQVDCEIRLEDPSASRLHALIHFSEGEYFIYDVGSTSKTYVNDKEISSVGKALSTGDRITIGESVFIFEAAYPAVKKQGGLLKQKRSDNATTLNIKPSENKQKKDEA